MQVSDALEPLVHVLGLRHKLVAGGLSYTTADQRPRTAASTSSSPPRAGSTTSSSAAPSSSATSQIAVLDEADHMADMGFLPEVTAILDQMPGGRPAAALLGHPRQGHRHSWSTRYLTDPVTHSTDDAKASVTTMEHHVLLVDPMHKKTITAEVANREGRTVVFVRTKLGADRVAAQLREQGVFAAALHGGLNQGARNRVLGAFRDGSAAGARRHRRRRPRHPRRRRLRRPAGRPAGRPQGLPAPLRPHRPRRRQGHRRDPGPAAPAPHHGADGPATPASTPSRPRPSPATRALRRPAPRTPSGIPVPEDQVRRVLEGEQAQRPPSGRRPAWRWPPRSAVAARVRDDRSAARAATARRLARSAG